MIASGPSHPDTRRSKRWALLLACVLACCHATAQEQIYVVKARDTLYDIARQNNTSVSQLVARNNLGRNSHIFVGQRLVVPGKKPAPGPALNSSVSKAIANTRVAPGRWKYIVIHHAAVDEGNVKSLDRYHREQRRMENGLAYHFLIGNGRGMKDGEIAIGNRWKKQLDGGHLASEAQNKVALGICLIGDFDKHPPTREQLRSLERLVRALMARCNLDAGDVKTHQQINVVGTRCPGSKFPTRSFLAGLKKPAG